MKITSERLTSVTITKRVWTKHGEPMLVIDEEHRPIETRQFRRFTIEIDEDDLKYLTNAIDYALAKLGYDLLEEEADVLTELVAGLRSSKPAPPPHEHDGTVEGWLGGIEDLHKKAENFGPSFSDSRVKYDQEDN